MTMNLTKTFDYNDIACLSTEEGVVICKILDLQKRKTNYAYLVETVDTHELFLAWPQVKKNGKSELRVLSYRNLEDNPNVDIAHRCFASRSYLLH